MLEPTAAGVVSQIARLMVQDAGFLSDGRIPPSSSTPFHDLDYSEQSEYREAFANGKSKAIETLTTMSRRWPRLAAEATAFFASTVVRC
jgi:hypothetical protein